MKKIITLFTFLVFGLTFAQLPQGISYQAIALNASGNPVVSAAVGIRLSILDNSATGNVLYTETHTKTTSTQGLFNLVIGQGTATLGTFATINWGTNSKFLKVEMDVAGGTNYVLVGTTQLLSVPYAMVAGNITNNQSIFSHYIGELFGGGIIVSLWKTNGIEHGLIISLTDLGTSIWSNIDTIACNALSRTDGQSNTSLIINQSGHTISAAKICDDYVSGGYSDWYLPSIYEFNECFNNAFTINRILGDINGLYPYNYYCSSTETVYNTVLSFRKEGAVSSGKSDVYSVRAMRKF